MFKNVEAIEVLLWGKRVGALAENSNGSYAFEYDPTWRRYHFSISPINMPISDSIFKFPNLPSETYYGLPPDLWIRSLIDLETL